MPQSPAHGLHLPDSRIDLIGFGRQYGSIHIGLTIGEQHGLYLVQREAACLSECDNRQLLNHRRCKLAASTRWADGCDQAFLLIKTQRVGRDSRAFDDLSDIHWQTIDLKLTSTSMMPAHDEWVHE